MMTITMTMTTMTMTTMTMTTMTMTTMTMTTMMMMLMMVILAMLVKMVMTTIATRKKITQVCTKKIERLMTMIVVITKGRELVIRKKQMTTMNLIP
jgi:hypothetical protein